MMSLRILPLCVASAGVMCSTAATAQELPKCDELSLPNPIYGAGASAITPLLLHLAPALAAAAEPVTLLYADGGPCEGLELLGNRPTVSFKYWAADGTQFSCDPPSSLDYVDFAYATDSAATCPEAIIPDTVGTFPAPVQVLQVITSLDSDETSISREALYFAYGWGEDGEAPPWTNEASLFKRLSDSVIHRVFAATIGLPAGSFQGTVSDSVVDDIFLAAATDPNSTLGYVTRSTASNAANREKVKSLAYQHTGQACGYWPDLGPETHDALHVRTGLYQLWTPSYLYARIDAQGVPLDTRVRDLVGWFAGADSALGNEITETTIEAGDVPICAMQVTREGFAGPVSSYAPDGPCGCFFELQATGSTACETCETDVGCGAAQKCRRNLCEAY
jgi:hypothetical protein